MRMDSILPFFLLSATAATVDARAHTQTLPRGWRYERSSVGESTPTPTQVSYPDRWHEIGTHLISPNAPIRRRAPTTMADISPLSATELFPKVSTSYRYSQRCYTLTAALEQCSPWCSLFHGAPGRWCSPWRSRLLVFPLVPLTALQAVCNPFHGTPGRWCSPWCSPWCSLYVPLVSKFCDFLHRLFAATAFG